MCGWVDWWLVGWLVGCVWWGGGGGLVVDSVGGGGELGVADELSLSPQSF